MSLETGNVVTVIDAELTLFGKQGELVAIENDGHEDGPYCVKFGSNSLSLFGNQAPQDGIFRFSEKELRKDQNWEITNWADYLYDSMWHSARTLSIPWTPELECMHEEHGEESVKSTVRILVNCWGTVYEMDVCEEHKFLHGLCGETLPTRNRKSAA